MKGSSSLSRFQIFFYSSSVSFDTLFSPFLTFSPFLSYLFSFSSFDFFLVISFQNYFKSSSRIKREWKETRDEKKSDAESICEREKESEEEGEKEWERREKRGNFFFRTNFRTLKKCFKGERWRTNWQNGWGWRDEEERKKERERRREGEKQKE